MHEHIIVDETAIEDRMLLAFLFLSHPTYWYYRLIALKRPLIKENYRYCFTDACALFYIK